MFRQFVTVLLAALVVSGCEGVAGGTLGAPTPSPATQPQPQAPEAPPPAPPQEPAPQNPPVVPPSNQGPFALSLAGTSMTMRLNESTSIAVTATPSGGFTGTLSLSVTGLPQVVSARFDGMSSVKRHQLVYGALADEMKTGVHALAITSRSPSEWAESPEAKASPKCLGGSGK